eukprot:516981-Alexandrium_andersonii.AAC.1
MLPRPSKKRSRAFGSFPRRGTSLGPGPGGAHRAAPGGIRAAAAARQQRRGDGALEAMGHVA